MNLVLYAVSGSQDRNENIFNFAKYSPNLSALDFCYFRVWSIEFDELDFYPSLNSIFLPGVALEIQVWNRQKMQFIKLDISNSMFQKSSENEGGELLKLFCHFLFF